MSEENPESKQGGHGAPLEGKEVVLPNSREFANDGGTERSLNSIDESKQDVVKPFSLSDTHPPPGGKKK